MSSLLIAGYRFGIFRLTDPGGLQTILDCNAKEAFHPHPDVPIYTVRAHFSCFLCIYVTLIAGR